jgi:predicted transcriptional regulator
VIAGVIPQQVALHKSWGTNFYSTDVLSSKLAIVPFTPAMYSDTLVLLISRAHKMQTTSLKLPDEIKQRAIFAAQQQGVSAHAFMGNAIAQATSAAELRASFVADALSARDSMISSGLGY